MADEKSQKTNEVKSALGGELPKNVSEIVEKVSKLSVLELSDLVNALQETLGVSAMPVAAAAPAAAGAASDANADEAASAGGTKTVVLANTGANKIAVIKALREINPALGLKEAKDMTEAVPAEVLKDAKAEDANEAAEKLKAAGATVELK